MNPTKIETNKEKFIAERNALMVKYGLKSNYEIIFPNYNIFPDDLKLALTVINKHNPHVVEKFEEVTNDKR